MLFLMLSQVRTMGNSVILIPPTCPQKFVPDETATAATKDYWGGGLVQCCAGHWNVGLPASQYYY